MSVLEEIRKLEDASRRGEVDAERAPDGVAPVVSLDEARRAD